MNKLYRNKEWLERKYIGEEKSDRQIANEYGVVSGTVGYWRKKFNIITRNRGEAIHLAKANHCTLSSEAIEWINGELLGDGRLMSYSKYSAQFAYGSKFFDYCKYVSETLNSFGINQCGKINEHYYKEMNCYTYFYGSLYYEELLPIHKKWYLYGKKIVPRDLELTPITCRQWYIGDGSLQLPKCLTFLPYIVLCTCGFSIDDVEFLKEKLNNLGFKATRYNCNNLIHISTKSTKNFLSYIGPCPVNFYQYKWDYYKKRRR